MMFKPGWEPKESKENLYSEETVDKLIIQLKEQEAQLSAQAALLKECKEVVGWVSDTMAYTHTGVHTKATALLPKLKAATEEFPGCIAQEEDPAILSALYYAALDWIAASQELGQEIPEPEGKWDGAQTQKEKP